MKKNVLKILSILLIPTLLTGCRTSTDDNKKDDDNKDDTDSCSEFTSKKIAKQYVLNYDWNYSYYNLAKNTTFQASNLITSKSQLAGKSNSFIKYVYEQQFRGGMNPNGDSIGYDIFEEYDDAYFEDHILIVGSVYERVGCSLYTTGVSSTTTNKYKIDSDGNKYISDTFTSFYVDTVFETYPGYKPEYRLILFVYDEFKISESAYKNKTKAEIVSYLTASKTRLKYDSTRDIWKDIWNKQCPDNKIE